MKKIAKVLVFSALMSLPIGLSANNNTVKKFDNAQRLYLVTTNLSELGCTMTAKGKTSSGHRFKIKGSCKEVIEALKSMA